MDIGVFKKNKQTKKQHFTIHRTTLTQRHSLFLLWSRFKNGLPPSNGHWDNFLVSVSLGWKDFDIVRGGEKKFVSFHLCRWSNHDCHWPQNSFGMKLWHFLVFWLEWKSNEPQAARILAAKSNASLQVAVVALSWLASVHVWLVSGGVADDCGWIGALIVTTFCQRWRYQAATIMHNAP